MTERAHQSATLKRAYRFMRRIVATRAFVSTPAGIALTALLVVLALAVTMLLQRVVPTTGYLFFYIAVVTGAWYGGRWAAGLGVVMATLAVEYYFIPPIHSFAVRSEAVPPFIEFTVSAVVVGWFSSWRRDAEDALRRARDELRLRVEERTAELRHANAQLLAEMEERRRAEEAYREAQADLARVSRVNAMGALAASISHEVNQPLAALVTNADACALWLGSDPPNLEEARAAVECIAREGTRASEIVRRIRAMFTRSAPERASFDMNELIREVAALLEPETLRRETVLETELAGGLPVVSADRVQLQQVIVNLAMNGIEAMNAVTEWPRRLVIRSRREGAEGLLVAVEDSGAGIEAKNIKRIFDAFYTTKGQGMGMGLAISQSIVEAHGGRLWASANPDHGVTLQFTLPAGNVS